jgi:hypothetical protein
MKKEDILKKLAELESAKNDPVKLSAMVSDLSKEVAETKGRGNGEAITDKAIFDTLTALGAGIFVVTNKIPATVVKFPYQDNYRIYYKGSGKPREKKDTAAAATGTEATGPSTGTKEGEQKTEDKTKAKTEDKKAPAKK